MWVYPIANFITRLITVNVRCTISKLAHANIYKVNACLLNKLYVIFMLDSHNSIASWEVWQTPISLRSFQIFFTKPTKKVSLQAWCWRALINIPATYRPSMRGEESYTEYAFLTLSVFEVLFVSPENRTYLSVYTVKFRQQILTARKSRLTFTTACCIMWHVSLCLRLCYSKTLPAK